MTTWRDVLPHPIAFVLSGGSSLGAIQVGMLKALLAAGLEPDLVVGTSAGALNGALVAERGLARAIAALDPLWRSFSRTDIFPGGRLAQVRQLLSTRNSLFPNDRLSKLIGRLLMVTHFEELQLPFGALATELTSFHGALFTTGELHPALLASAAIPGVFPPVEIGGKTYVDGALIAQVPLRAALTMGAGSLVVLDAGEICHNARPPRHAAEMFLATLHVSMRQRVRVEAPAVARQRPLLYLPTPCPINRSLLDFSQSEWLIDEAEALAGAFLDRAVLPETGRMSGAPHYHGEEPLWHLTEEIAAT